MTKSVEWKRRRAAVLPGRIDYARRRFLEEHIPIVSEANDSIVIRCHCENVRYSPFTGGYTGKGISPGKGLENLIAICKNKNKRT